jgi:Cysteine-rich CPXCG
MPATQRCHCEAHRVGLLKRCESTTFEDGDYSDKSRGGLMLETQVYQCPYCGEAVETTLDLSAGDQQYIEDCAVCCRPVLFDLRTDGVDWQLQVFREDE